VADIQEYSVSIKFKTEGSEKAAKDAEKVKDSIGKLKGSTKGFDGLKTGLSSVGKFAGKAATALKGFAVVTGAALVKAGKSASKYSKEMMDYIETVNLFRASMGDLADKAMELVNRGELELGLNPQEMMDAIASFQNLSEGFGIASDRAFIMSKNLSQLAGDLSSFANISYEAAQKKLMSGFSGQVLPLRKYGIALDQASLQELAYSLGIEQRVKTMTRAQKTELIYYQIMKSTQKMQGDLGRTLMSPANALRVLQNEFKSLARAVGSIFIPIIQKIIPIMRMVTKALTQAAQAIAAFFGFKIENYTADLDNVGGGLEGIADDIDDVGGAAEGTAKKLNKMLMPFDELNNINSNAGSSSGSGSGSGGIGGGGSLGIELPEYDMFAFVDDRIEKFSDVLEKARDAVHKFNELLAGIDWNKIKEGAGNVGKNIAEFLNIGITEIDWNLIGKTFGEGLNSIIELLYNFVNTIKFSELGKSISEAINGLFNTVEWDKLGETVNKGINGALDTGLSFMNNLDTGAIFDAIIKFVENIDWIQIALKVGTMFMKTMYNPAMLIRGVTGIVELLIDSVEKVIQNFSGRIEDAGGDVGYALWEGLKEVIGGAGGFIYENFIKPILDALGDTHIAKAAKKIADDLSEPFNTAKETILEKFSEIQEGASQIFEKLWRAILRGSQDAVNRFIDGINEIIAGINEVGDYLGVHLNELSRVTWADEYDERMEKLKNNTAETMENVNSTVSTKVTQAQQGIKQPLSTMQQDFTSAFDKIKLAASGNLEETEKTVSTKGSSIQNIISTSFGRAKDAANTDMDTLKNQTTTKLNEVANSSVYSKIKSSIVSAFDNAQKARELGGSTATGYKEGFEGTASHFSIMSTVKDRFRQALGSYNEARQWGSDMATGFKDGLNAKQQEIIDKVRGMANSIRSLLHFSRPDEGPLRDYETWMPDMIKGLSDSLLKAQPVLDNAVNIVADKIANTLGSVTVPNVEQSVYSTGYNTEIIKNIGNKMPNTSKDETTTNMIRATYEAVSRALSDNTSSDNSQVIQVNIGNRQVYKGYGQYQDEESNMLGVSVS